ncbi:MAG: SIMPL domain-containing protein [Armatimonadetes bacterium]|nr:SIMPL domain-containing protein [Armatimonadota bacterium]
MAEETEKGGTFRVQATHRIQIPADRADFRVTVTGASLVAGTEALKKAREVAQMVQGLTALDVPESDIHLEDVTANVASGALLKSSQATYRLRIHCAKLDKLADILGVITSQKNAELQSLQWGYPDDEAAQDEWLRLCIARANKKAALIAEGLGVKLLGVRSFSERLLNPEAPQRQFSSSMMRGRMASMDMRVTSEELGLDVSHVKTVEMQVDVEYRVSDFA